MSLEVFTAFAPAFALIVFRLAGMMLIAPVFGSALIPLRVRWMFALVLAVGLLPVVPTSIKLPSSTVTLAMALGGELIIGGIIGLAASMVFAAARAAGEIIGQQIGLGISEIFDPQHGHASGLGEFYHLLATVVFLGIGGHHALIRGVAFSFEAVPPLTFFNTQSIFDILMGLLQSCAVLALRLSGPIIVTMLLVDLAIGFVGRTMPQFNMMSIGLSLRVAVGIAILAALMAASGGVLEQALRTAMNSVSSVWRTI